VIEVVVSQWNLPQQRERVQAEPWSN